jgi:phage terminase large subunit
MFDHQTPTVPASEPIRFPEPFQVLFKPKRHKVLYGGRGAGRSWSCARALLLEGAKRPIRVLCARELQKSIEDSVHRLLSDQVVALGLASFYDILKKNIVGKNGTIFSFEGIKNNATAIKSYEGMDYCWVEEAAKVSKTSWGILIPTIRKPNSEIWLTFNPELATDYTYRRFVLEPSEDSVVVKTTWRDNPWFPDVLRSEMEDLRKRDYDSFLNVWEGHCLQMLEGTIYAKELRRAQEEGRICKVPWDRETPVETFWDLGWSDHTSIWFGQKVAMQFRVLAYFEGSMEDIHYYLKHCQSREYVYGSFWLPHDARAKQLGSKRSIEEVVRASGRQVRVAKKLSIEDGINAARIIFPNCWFDEQECEEGLDRLRHYRYRVIDGQITGAPLHDEASDGADAFRTLAVSIKEPREKGGLVAKLSIKRVLNDFVDSAPGLGWMR